MLSTVHRLAKKNDFDAVFNKGQGAKQGFLLVKTLKNTLLKNRFGFVVSKKISTKATVRNKVKRRLKASVVSTLAQMKNSSDVIVVALPGIEKKEFVEIKESLEAAFKKLKLV